MAEDVFGLVGTTVAGAFHVESVVAEGGFAVVYRAHHSGFRAPVALKCLKIPQQLGAEEQVRFQEQFQAEAELLFKLSASIPTVVRPLHVDAIRASDGSFVPFMALEWLEGETLEALAARRSGQREPFSLQELACLLTPVAYALQRAHSYVGPQGPISIVHRDMKPENIFLARVGGEEVVKILDFGIGKAKSVASQVAGRASQSDVGLASFTPAYGAPEQWLPKRYGQTGPWTDVWGLALTIVEVISGRPILEGDQAAMMGAALDPARRPTPRNEGLAVQDEVEAVFERALALDPRDRYASAGEFWDELLRALDVGPLASLSSPSGTYQAVAREGSLRRGATSPHAVIPDLEPGAPAASSRPPGSAPPPAHDAGRPSGLDLDLDPGEIPSQRPPPKPPSGSSWRAVTGVSEPPARSASDPVVSPALPGGASPASNEGAATASEGRGFPEADSGLMPPPSIRPVAPARPPRAPLWQRVLLPAGLVGAGVLVTLIDGAYAAATGEVATLGPVRPAWLAGGLVLTGVASLVYRMFQRDD